MASYLFGTGSKGSPKSLTVTKSPDQQTARLNKVYVSPTEMSKDTKFVKIENKYFSLSHSQAVKPGQIGLTMFQRKFSQVSIGQTVNVEPFDPFKGKQSPYLACITLELSFLNLSMDTGQVIDAKELTSLMLSLYSDTLFSKGQTFNFEYRGVELCMDVISLVLVDIHPNDKTNSESLDADDDLEYAEYGILNKNSVVELYKSHGCQAKIENGAKYQSRPRSLLKKGFKFEDLGIGGLEHEFKQIFRRAFSSRIFPPEIIKKMGIQHVKGLLLHGPPGTGKTLLARQIGKMLNSVEPIIVNGPEILNKYVGESEQNVRKLFLPAEEEYKQEGEASRLHMIIFDELDAICKQRGSKNDGTGVGDSVVNQLLSKMDGVDQLNNILIIGMTNRIDLIDDALLRPGRLEVHIEIGLPDKEGRKQILNVHTASMRKNNLLEKDVDLDEIAELTKNYSGAEIFGLCKSAASFSFNKHVKLGASVSLRKNYENITVSRDNFLVALQEIRPSFGADEDDIEKCMLNGIIDFGSHINDIVYKGSKLVDLIKYSKRVPITSHLLYGDPGSGKTALAAFIAQRSGYPFIKMITPDKLLNLSESAKISEIINTFKDAYKSELSIVIIDSIERILEWVSIGPRFSNSLLQTILIYLKKIPEKSHRLHILATANDREVLNRMELFTAFDAVSVVQNVFNIKQLKKVLKGLGGLEDEVLDKICSDISSSISSNDVISVPIKEIILIHHMACQEETPSERVNNFVKNFLEKFGVQYDELFENQNLD